MLDSPGTGPSTSTERISMKIKRDRRSGHVIHGGIGVFWRGQRGHARVCYVYTPWLRLRIDLSPRRSREPDDLPY